VDNCVQGAIVDGHIQVDGTKGSDIASRELLGVVSGKGVGIALNGDDSISPLSTED